MIAYRRKPSFAPFFFEIFSKLVEGEVEMVLDLKILSNIRGEGG